MEKRFVCSVGEFQNLKSIVQTLEKMWACGRRQVQERSLKHVRDYTFRQEGSKGERAMGAGDVLLTPPLRKVLCCSHVPATTHR